MIETLFFHFGWIGYDAPTYLDAYRRFFYVNKFIQNGIT